MNSFAFLIGILPNLQLKFYKIPDHPDLSDLQHWQDQRDWQKIELKKLWTENEVTTTNIVFP